MHLVRVSNYSTLFGAGADRYVDPLRSVVVDGVTIGHPCCSVHNCTIPLDSGVEHAEYILYTTRYSNLTLGELR